MKIGITMLAAGMMALIAGAIYQRNGTMNWGRMMRGIRWNRMLSMMMGRRMLRRWIG